MSKAHLSLLIAICLLTGCSKPKSPPEHQAVRSAVLASGSAAAPNSAEPFAPGGDPVYKRAVALAGSSATNCGVLKSMVPAEMNAASECVEASFKAKTPFYVEYEMPGLTVAIAGDAQGKVYSLQAGAGGAGLTSEECPAELRAASSGRVTCYATGALPVGHDVKSSEHPRGAADMGVPPHSIPQK
jgi:hypothetical protein